MDAGSPPSAIATGIRSPRSAISRQWAAPTLWRCQCMAKSALSNTCTRYMPTLRMPVFGSLVITCGRVMYGPPSPGQDVMIGSRVTSTSEPCTTTSWQAGVPRTIRGGNFATSAIVGNMAIFSRHPSGTFIFNSSEMRAPIESRSSTPSAMLIRRIDPNRLIPTGMAHGDPSCKTGCSNSKAGPPPGLFMQRSATSDITRSTDM